MHFKLNKFIITLFMRKHCRDSLVSYPQHCPMLFFPLSFSQPDIFSHQQTAVSLAFALKRARHQHWWARGSWWPSMAGPNIPDTQMWVVTSSSLELLPWMHNNTYQCFTRNWDKLIDLCIFLLVVRVTLCAAWEVQGIRTQNRRCCFWSMTSPTSPSLRLCSVSFPRCHGPSHQK